MTQEVHIVVVKLTVEVLNLYAVLNICHIIRFAICINHIARGLEMKAYQISHWLLLVDVKVCFESLIEKSKTYPDKFTSQ